MYSCCKHIVNRLVSSQDPCRRRPNPVERNKQPSDKQTSLNKHSFLLILLLLHHLDSPPSPLGLPQRRRKSIPIRPITTRIHLRPRYPLTLKPQQRPQRILIHLRHLPTPPPLRLILRPQRNLQFRPRSRHRPFPLCTCRCAPSISHLRILVPTLLLLPFFIFLLLHLLLLLLLLLFCFLFILPQRPPQLLRIRLRRPARRIPSQLRHRRRQRLQLRIQRCHPRC